MRIEARPTLILNAREPEKDAIDLYWLVRLLKDIRGGSSLVLASKNSGVSYRGVWGKLNQVEASLGIPLVVRTKGHGSKLTEFGSFLCQFIEELQGAYVQHGINYEDTLHREIKKYQKIENARWSFYSSSDSVIQKVVTEVKGFGLKIAGSGESLEQLLSNNAHIAGYHVSDEKNSRIIHERLRKHNIEIFPVMKRTQGFMVKRGNPLRIHAIEDLLNPKIRFINRQISSGTRLLLDTSLIEQGIDPSEINGYLHEEFTHSAVANAILAGKADVGLGVKNVALENGLGFVPLKDEVFFIAMHKEMLAHPESSKLVRRIRSYSSKIPGYKAISLNRQVESWL